MSLVCIALVFRVHIRNHYFPFTRDGRQPGKKRGLC
jgi:hypothetical protein